MGRITDDTQMTLFTAEGLLRGYARNAAEGGRGTETALVREAYLRWLDTQHNDAPLPELSSPHRTGWLRKEPWLYARRAPGRACEFGLQKDYVPDPRTPIAGTPGPVNPDAKGCGAVMRSAPFGFADGSADHAFELAAHCAQITHGHPTSYYAAGAFAAMISHLVR